MSFKLEEILPRRPVFEFFAVLFLRKAKLILYELREKERNYRNRKPNFEVEKLLEEKSDDKKYIMQYIQRSL